MRKRVRRLNLSRETLRALDAGTPDVENQNTTTTDMTSTASQCTVSCQNGACTGGVACLQGQCVAVRTNFSL